MILTIADQACCAMTNLFQEDFIGELQKRERYSSP